MGALLDLAKAATATPAGRESESAERERRIRDGMARLWDRHGWREHRDFPEALRIALAMPDAALALLAAEGAL